MRLIFATLNHHKLDEVRALLRGTSLDLVGLDEFPAIPEPPEDHSTFEENAYGKADFIFRRLGIPVIADDSGLEVYALGGRPGVHSKRYSPEATASANNALLLKELGSKPDRRAQFRCVLALVAPGFRGHVQGACAGSIGYTLHGSGGFGYDPLFHADALGGRTLAEATMEEKNAISHRGAAFRQLTDLLAAAGLAESMSTTR